MFANQTNEAFSNIFRFPDRDRKDDDVNLEVHNKDRIGDILNNISSL